MRFLSIGSWFYKFQKVFDNALCYVYARFVARNFYSVGHNVGVYARFAGYYRKIFVKHAEQNR